MKSRDYALIGGAVILAIISSIIVSKFIFVKHSSGQKVEVVPIITSSFSQPDKRYFNSSAIDLTQFISIGNSSNQNPFQQPNPTAP